MNKKQLNDSKENKYKKVLKCYEKKMYQLFNMTVLYRLKVMHIEIQL